MILIHFLSQPLSAQPGHPIETISAHKQRIHTGLLRMHAPVPNECIISPLNDLTFSLLPFFPLVSRFSISFYFLSLPPILAVLALASNRSEFWLLPSFPLLFREPNDVPSLEYSFTGREESNITRRFHACFTGFASSAIRSVVSGVRDAIRRKIFFSAVEDETSIPQLL